MTGAEQLAGWASELALTDVPDRVVAYAKSQVLSQLAAARSGLQHPLGTAITRAFGSPLQADAKRAAYVLAALSMALEYDDTLYAGHLSHSTVNVPLSYASSLELDGRQLLTAIIAANECAARITAAAALGPFRGQMATYAHLAGAVAGRLRAEAAPSELWVRALGLAFAAPPWHLQHAFLASSAKTLAAASAVQTGLDACDGAAAGLSGPSDIFEHRDGFLQRFAEVPLPEMISLGLSERWHTETLSFKCVPTSTGIQSSVDCALALHRRLGSVDPESIAEIVVQVSQLTALANEAASSYLRGPGTPVPALQYAVAYCVATALLTGALSVADFDAPLTRDPVRWSLAEKVRVAHDPKLTHRALAATSPLGEALRQAGERARAWVTATGRSEAWLAQLAPSAPSVTFEHAEKAIGARLTVKLNDGRELVQERLSAAGAASEATRRHHSSLMRAKYLDSGGPAPAADTIASLEFASCGEVTRAIGSSFKQSERRPSRRGPCRRGEPPAPLETKMSP
jgi:2-methylcitrate dehydratase PrpD